MILSNHLEQTQFVALSRIVADVAGEFSLRVTDVYDLINDRAPWTWGDTNRVMVGNVEFLADILTDLRVSDFGVETYCSSLRDFLTTQNAYVDIAN